MIAVHYILLPLFHKDNLILNITHWKRSKESLKTANEQWPGEYPRQEAPTYL